MTDVPYTKYHLDEMRTAASAMLTALKKLAEWSCGYDDMIADSAEATFRLKIRAIIAQAEAAGITADATPAKYCDTCRTRNACSNMGCSRPGIIAR